MIKRMLILALIKSCRQNQIQKLIKRGEKVPENMAIALAPKSPKESTHKSQPNKFF